MMKFYKYFCVVITLALAGPISAQENTSFEFSLPQAIAFALKNSPSHLNSELDLQNAEYRKKEIGATIFPQVNASIDLKDYFVIPTSLIPEQAFNPMAGPNDFLAVKFGTKYNATAGLSASQLLYSSDYIFAVKAIKELMNLSRINVNRSKAELTAQVSKAYYNVIINKDRLKLLDANVERLKKIFEDTQALYRQGFTEQIDVERLEVQYNNLIEERKKFVNLIGLFENMLKFQMGYKITEAIVLTDNLDIGDAEYSDLSVNRQSISMRPDIQMLQSQQNLLNMDVQRLKWGYMPTLAAYGTYQYNTQRQKADFFVLNGNNAMQRWYKIALIGATLNMNLFDGFQRHNKIQQAKITALQNQNQLNNAVMGGELEATMASITYKNAYSNLKTQKRNMTLSEHVFEVTKTKYESGLGNNLEVVSAEIAIKEAQTNYYNAVYEMIVAKLDYQKAMGLLNK